MKSMTLLAAALLAAADALPDRMPDVWGRSVQPRQLKAEQQPKTTPKHGVSTSQGCFKSSGDLEFKGTPDFNDINKCGTITCNAAGYPVGGTRGGSECWCGYKYPPKDDLVEDKECNISCTGFGDFACGGIETFSIYNTGLNLSVPYLGEEEEDSKSSKVPSSTAIATAPASTVVVTQAPASSAPPSEQGGTNVAGIVAGVVVGVVVFAAVLAGGFLYMRKKRNREIEEEHRRNAAVNAFIGKPPGSSGGLSMTDSRLDPVMAHRRLSDGSIADNQDYSRRILRVTNA